MAAALRRRVSLQMQHGRIFPNLYVFIVAESAKARKTTAMNYGHRILNDSFPLLHVFGDDMTSQGLVKYLYAKAVVGKDGKKEPQGDFVIFSDELADLFDYDKGRAAKLVIMLTTNYMCRDVYDHLTSRDSLERLYNMYPVVLGATDPSNLKVLPQEAIGGLTGRLIWVIERTKRHINSGWVDDDRTGELRRQALHEYLVHDLQRISNLQGDMSVEPKAREIYDVWYKQLSGMDAKDKNTDAFYHRCHTTAIQLAMLLSIAEGDSLIITSNHMLRGMDLIKEQLVTIGRVTEWSGTSTYEQQRAKMILYLQKSGGLAKRSILLKHLGVNFEDFAKIVTTLVQDETILEPKVVGYETVIRLTKAGLGVTVNGTEPPSQ